MKKYIISIFAGMALLTGCVDLDRNPLSEGSSENWYSNEQEITLSLNALYNPLLWYTEAYRWYNTDRWTDDWNQRDKVYDWVAGDLTGTADQVTTPWANYYKGISRANTLIYSLEENTAGLSDAITALYDAEARFFRASFYSYLIMLWGDVPYYEGRMTLEEAYKMGRVSRDYILDKIYEDLDKAAAGLPKAYSGVQRVTKGAAYAMKARVALWMSDWDTCAKAAKACMDLNVYSLHPSFRDLFLSKTKKSSEFIFELPNSNELDHPAYYDSDKEVWGATVKSFYPRTAGGNNVAQPSWELFFAFPCTDGKFCDESPLYDPADPFANRDPRLAETFVKFGSEHLGYIYEAKNSALKVMRVKDGAMVDNKDNKAVDKWAPYNGMALRKGVDEEYVDDNKSEKNVTVLRYADVLLMYAEAMNELGRGDDPTVADALNSIRARAYGVAKDDTTYPKITETGQVALRRIIRCERRCELAWENRRWFDLIRWRVCEDALRTAYYQLPTPAQMAINEATGYWIFPKDFRPVLKYNSIVNIEGLESFPGYFLKIEGRNFGIKSYLFPIPSKERTVCPNLTQNPGY